MINAELQLKDAGLKVENTNLKESLNSLSPSWSKIKTNSQLEDPIDQYLTLEYHPEYSEEKDSK